MANVPGLAHAALPSEECGRGGQAPIKLTNGREAHVTMHCSKAAKKKSKNSCATSLERSSNLYPEI